MKYSEIKTGLSGILTAAILVFTVCSSGEEEAPMDISSLIPATFNGWRIEGDIENYDRESIFKYMDGAGEIYRMYDYRRLQVVRLMRKGQPEIKVEMFDMGKPSDAYGVFSHMREGVEAGVGDGSEYRKSLLCFWRGRYFFCLVAEEETPEVKEFLFNLGGLITESIESSGEKPDILNLLPGDNLIVNNIRYFHLMSTLNYHYFLADKNILNLDSTAEAVLARYGAGETYLLIVKYNDDKLSRDAYKTFKSTYLQDKNDRGVYQLSGDKWLSADTVGAFIVIVFDAGDERTAVALTDSVKAKIRDSK